PIAQATASNESTVDVPPDTSAEPMGLTAVERNAFQELARRLGRPTRPDTAGDGESALHDLVAAPMADPAEEPAAATPPQPFSDPDESTAVREVAPIFDRFPIGVLIYRLNHLLYANRAFLRWSGYASLDALTEAGGLDALLIESGATAIEHDGEKTFALSTAA